MEHTPGPWTVGPVFDNDGEPEIIVEHKTPFGNLVVACALSGLVGQEANARLIAAAPELLEALQLADAMLEGAHMNADVVCKKVKAPIAKATGEQHD